MKSTSNHYLDIAKGLAEIMAKSMGFSRCERCRMHRKHNQFDATGKVCLRCNPNPVTVKDRRTAQKEGA